MDSSAPDFIKEGSDRCNFCSEVDGRSQELSRNSLSELINTLNKLKRESRSKYHCIIGISGGVDSCYAALKAHDLGLNALLVHYDNGWDSSAAIRNITAIVKHTNFDYYSYIHNWPNYRDCLKSFLRAGVVDIELLFDNAMLALNYRAAKRFNVKRILSGQNSNTESIRMPKNWNWFKYDRRNIHSIVRRGNADDFKMAIGVPEVLLSEFFLGIKWINFLDYLDYQKDLATSELLKRVGFEQFPYKHYESILTRFYQGFILPVKFGIDKRRPHLSSQIISGDITRSEALKILSESPYLNGEEMWKDMTFFMRKMDWSFGEFSSYLNQGLGLHTDYKSEKFVFETVRQIKRLTFG